MFLIGLGALLVLGGVSYIAHTAIWRGPFSGSNSVRRPVRETLDPQKCSVGFLGLGTNWPGILHMVIGAILLVWGISFLRRPQTLGTPESGAGIDMAHDDYSGGSETDDRSGKRPHDGDRAGRDREGHRKR